MRRRSSAHDALNTRLLQAIDWVQRTGWTTREGDMALAMQIFDGWCAAAPQLASTTDPEDHDALVEALQAAFVGWYGDEVVCHLTTIFTLSLELHLRTRHTGGKGDLI